MLNRKIALDYMCNENKDNSQLFRMKNELIYWGMEAYMQR